MRINRQTIIERLYLSFRAYWDVKTNGFQLLKMTVHRSPNGVGDARPSNTKESVEEQTISPFINIELSKFEAFRDYLLTGKHYWIKLSIKGKIPYFKFLSFRRALEGINSIINNYSTYLELTSLEYENEMKVWMTRREGYIRGGEPHMVQMCANHILELQRDYYSETKPYYASIVKLLNQKIELLNVVESRVMNARSKQFLRIRYYYSKASRYYNDLDPTYINDAKLRMISNTEILGEYENIRREASEKLEKYKKDIEVFSNR